jgi:hypothetical protein
MRPKIRPVGNTVDRIRRRYSTVGVVWDVWGGEPEIANDIYREIADGLHSASLPRTAQMNPLGKRGGLPRLLSISVLCMYACTVCVLHVPLECREYSP